MTTISLSARNSEVLGMIDGEAPNKRERAVDSQTSDLLDALAERNIHSRRDLLAALGERDAEAERLRAALRKMLAWAPFVGMYDPAVREHDEAEARALTEQPKP